MHAGPTAPCGTPLGWHDGHIPRHRLFGAFQVSRPFRHPPAGALALRCTCLARSSQRGASRPERGTACAARRSMHSMHSTLQHALCSEAALRGGGAGLESSLHAVHACCARHPRDSFAVQEPHMCRWGELRM
jgi:hypothetical protein